MAEEIQGYIHRQIFKHIDRETMLASFTQEPDGTEPDGYIVCPADDVKASDRFTATGVWRSVGPEGRRTRVFLANQAFTIEHVPDETFSVTP